MASIFERITEAFKSDDGEVVKEAVKAAATAGNILQAVGGKENVESVANCASP